VECTRSAVNFTQSSIQVPEVQVGDTTRRHDPHDPHDPQDDRDYSGYFVGPERSEYAEEGADTRDGASGEEIDAEALIHRHRPRANALCKLG
jgi:hypothetical protein